MFNIESCHPSLVKVISHRGNSFAATQNNPHLHENVLYGFKHALRSGADGIELDIHLSKDGTPHVIHDNVLGNKVSQPPFCLRFTDKEDPSHLLNYYGDSFIKNTLRVGSTGHQIPTLIALLTMVAAHTQTQDEKIARPIVNIELKDNDATLPDKVIAAIHQFKESSPLSAYLDWDQIYFCSCNHEHLKRIALKEPHAHVVPVFTTVAFFATKNFDPKTFKVAEDAQYLPEAVTKILETAKQLRASNVDLIANDIKPPLLQALQKAGLGLFASVSYSRSTPEAVVEKLVTTAMQIKEKGIPFVFKADEPLIFKQVLNARGQNLQEVMKAMASLIVQRINP